MIINSDTWNQGSGALAYVGPGGGFVISISLLAVLAALLAVVFVLVLTPVSAVLALARKIRRKKGRLFQKAVVLGLDGLDPKVIQRLMDQGKLPNFERLASTGCFMELQTVAPPLSPCAWSSLATGTVPSQHRIHGFITRNPVNYAPRLSSYEITEPRRKLTVGRYEIPLSRPRVRTLRQGRPFWHDLAREGLEVTVLRVPITFPPEPFRGRLLSGMCLPDLLGSQGTYTYYGETDRRRGKAGGDFCRLHFDGKVARTWILGPGHPYTAKGDNLRIPLRIKKTARPDALSLKAQNERFDLQVGQFSRWVRLCFRAGPIKIHGMVQFYLIAAGAQVQVYMTPVQIDPERPAMKISHPSYFSDYLAKRHGPYGTLGLLEDTSAVNDGLLDESAFLRQVWQHYHQQKRMFLDTLNSKRDDVIVCVFDAPDRIQHMFWRQMEKDSLPSEASELQQHARVIERAYLEMDGLVGETLESLDPQSLLLVVSDHGFTSFRRGVNLNTWLHRNGYLHLQQGRQISGKWLKGVDWSRTKAYAMGLAAIFINLKGRESSGIVNPGRESDELSGELRAKLEELVDQDGPAESGEDCRAIRRVLVTKSSSEERRDGPDLIVCYEAGYRCSWECAKGQITEDVFVDNTRKWSGDHCVDPELVPGVLFSNHRLGPRHARITDIAPTMLDVFGIKPTASMAGNSLLTAPQRTG